MRKKRIRLALTQGQLFDLYNLAADRAMEEREADPGCALERRYERLASWLNRQGHARQRDRHHAFRLKAQSLVLRLVKNFPELIGGDEARAFPVPAPELSEWIENEIFQLSVDFPGFGLSRFKRRLEAIANNDGIDEERAASDALRRMQANETRA